MPEVLFNIVVYIGAFFVVWAGAGLIVGSINKLSHRLHIPAFLVSFVILGLLTSTPEIAVGLTSISSGEPGIFVGNLLGGIPVIFLLIIPVLAIIGRGFKLNHNLSHTSILLALSITMAPFLVVLDHKVTNLEGVMLIVGYLVVVYLIRRENRGSAYNFNLLKLKSYSFLDILKVLGGTVIVLVSSNIIVSKTLYFSQYFDIAPFYISLIVLSLGTNLPEITIAIRAIIIGKKDIAFGDYLGSAAANALLFGIFSIMIRDSVLQVDNFLGMFAIVGLGVLLFFHFSKTKRTISPKEGLVLLLVYAVFIAVELLPGIQNR